ncbi:MAG: hypothetical protein HOH77_03315, partial [Candidatus Latescibacteria bacterium]|nr:hypothetical protein [Candidatus Latescibacterota bacterium]
LIVCLRPDLYVFRSDTPNFYRPVWHTEISLMHRPMLADLDTDGLPEILFNNNDAIRIVERSEPAFTVVSPQIITARPLGISTVEIDWMQTPEATTYRIYRAIGNASLTLLTTISDRTLFTDNTLAENQIYRYQVSAILPDGTELRSSTIPITPNKPPAVTKLTIQNTTQLEVQFSEPMSEKTAEPTGYAVNNLGHPTSVVLDKGKTRALLTFPSPFTDANTTLMITNASDLQNTPINARLNYPLFEIQIDPAHLQRADANQNNIIDFPDFIAFAQTFNTNNATFDFNEDGIVNFPDFITFAQIFGRSVS